MKIEGIAAISIVDPHTIKITRDRHSLLGIDGPSTEIVNQGKSFALGDADHVSLEFRLVKTDGRKVSLEKTDKSFLLGDEPRHAVSLIEVSNYSDLEISTESTPKRPSAPKRSAPAEVAAIYLSGVKIFIPHFAALSSGMKHNGGYIEASDPATGKRLWLKEVYRYYGNLETESDRRDVFIRSLTVQNQQIIVSDEQGVFYHIALTENNGIEPEKDGDISPEAAIANADRTLKKIDFSKGHWKPDLTLISINFSNSAFLTISYRPVWRGSQNTRGGGVDFRIDRRTGVVETVLGQ